MSMPRAAMSVATRARMSPLLKPDSAWVRAVWLLLPCSAIALMPFLQRNSATLLAPNLVRVNTSTWLQLCSWMMWASSCFFLARLTGCVIWVMLCTVVLRGVTWILCGLRSSRSARSRISSLKVAENSRLCLSLGTSARIFFTSGRNPMSSMRSASSSTRICTVSRCRNPWPMRSSRRPGVATRMSTPPLSLAICGFMPTPPNTTVEVSMNPQIAKLKGGVDILVATPGRLLDLIGQGFLHLDTVQILVLDEADRMLDMGFLPDVKMILALVPKDKQSLLFSATFSDEIRDLADRLLRNPQSIQVTPRNTTVQSITQITHPVSRAKKKQLLAHIIQEHNWSQVLVFTRTKFGANNVAEYLCKNGINAMALHGNKSQSARTQALGGFKSGDIRALVATDIAARGIDIDDLPHVVNYEIPNVPEVYVHRIGRT